MLSRTKRARSIPFSLLLTLGSGALLISACGGAAAEGVASPETISKGTTEKEPSEKPDAPIKALRSEMKGVGWSAVVPYLGESKAQTGFSDIRLEGSGHEAHCRLFEEAPESFRQVLDEAIAPFPSENSWRRTAEVSHIHGRPVIVLTLVKPPESSSDFGNKIDTLDEATLDAYEHTQLTLGLFNEQFLICHPSKPERSDWFATATRSFLEALTFNSPPPPPSRSTITIKMDPEATVRSKEYGFKWWTRRQDPEKGTIDSEYSLSFWGSLDAANAGLTQEITDPKGQVANIAHFPGIASDVQANFSLMRLGDGRYAYTIGGGATLFHVRTKLTGPLETEAELAKRLKNKGAYNFTVQKYMPYSSQSHAVDVRYSREANDPADVIRIQVDAAKSEGRLDPTGRPMKTERRGKNGLDFYQRIYDSAGHLP